MQADFVTELVRFEPSNLSDLTKTANLCYNKEMEYNSKNYTIDDFDKAMDEATLLHIAGKYQEVLELRLRANEDFTGSVLGYSGMPSEDYLTEEDKITVAGNKRNIAATYERLGRDGEAVGEIEAARKLHGELLGNASDSTTEQRLDREVAADEFYIGALGMKATLLMELDGESVEYQGEDVLSHMRSSLDHFAIAREFDDEGAPIHQYELNGLRRASMAESLYGDRKQGRKLGMTALSAVRYSETDRSTKERAKAVLKAGVGALGALGISVAVSVGARKTAIKATQKLL